MPIQIVFAILSDLVLAILSDLVFAILSDLVLAILSDFSTQVRSRKDESRIIDSVTIHVINNTGKENINLEPTIQAQLRVDILVCMRRLYCRRYQRLS